ncbi:MAG: phosphoribosylformylglycinamidine synthase I [Chloroflexota bacterium]|nr:phosphoribosylformylglycinamidine synthase I [Chloroflexota bacterium]
MSKGSVLPKALVLYASGTNRDGDAAAAIALAGGLPEIVHVNQLRHKERRWTDYQMLVIPGGFSYGDALGAGKLLALDLMAYFAEETSRFVAAGKPVIGICNGFQALVKAGILPGIRSGGPQEATGEQQATLTRNQRGRFECRWVTLLANQSSVCLWTQGAGEVIRCPVAHGEGNFIPRDQAVLDTLRDTGQIALVYVREDGSPADGEYPANPNGSVADIAGICNPVGNVLGLMPHPEDHIDSHLGPRWTRGQISGLGLVLFQNGVRHAGEG